MQFPQTNDRPSELSLPASVRSYFAEPGARHRLRIVETLPLSAQHRAVLIERDTVQHLVILGPNGETVVETGIKNNE